MRQQAECRRLTLVSQADIQRGKITKRDAHAAKRKGQAWRCRPARKREARPRKPQYGDHLGRADFVENLHGGRIVGLLQSLPRGDPTVESTVKILGCVVAEAYWTVLDER